MQPCIIYMFHYYYNILNYMCRNTIHGLIICFEGRGICGSGWIQIHSIYCQQGYGKYVDMEITASHLLIYNLIMFCHFKIILR